MTFRITALAGAALPLAAAPLFATFAESAQAAPTVVSSSVFATGGPVGGSAPDSITDVNGTVWVEYGNGAVSTGGSGDSTIVQYSAGGAVEHTWSIAGLVDGLKYNPVTGMVWVLQNNDGNATLSLINPKTDAVSGPLRFASPPYVYGANSARGYDDVAFLNGKVYLSYTNPVNPADSVLQVLDQGNTPSGKLTTTSILTAQQTNPLFTSSSQNPPDIDSLKSTPNGQLVLTSEGDGLGSKWVTSDGRYTLIANPGTAMQTVTNVRVTNAAGVNANAMDDVIMPGASAGTLYVTDTKTNDVYAVHLTGLVPTTPIVSFGSFGEVALVNPVTGVVEMPLLTGLKAPHGMDFVAASAPEPSTWGLMLLGLAGVATVCAHRRRPGRREPILGL
ncbi:MAG: PEP-CTERM sorting domain-containing protein [Gammaproteobacteria bacterium]|nr:PEP-CTERM sorting domain-containing protein [Gammaproteobacteria bacterium]